MKNKNIVKYIARVVKNNSLENTDNPAMDGAVQIFVEPIMNGWEEEHYPWAYPDTAGTGGSSDFGTSNIPEEDSFVWVWYEREDFKNWFYGGSVNNSEISPHDLFMTNVQAELLSQSVYPDAKYMYFKNEICVGVDSSDSNPEFFMYHPEGASLFVDNLGQVFVDGLKVFLGMNKAGSISVDLDNQNGITTGNSHLGVIDSIVGTPVIPCPTVFAKITP